MKTSKYGDFTLFVVDKIKFLRNYEHLFNLFKVELVSTINLSYEDFNY